MTTEEKDLLIKDLSARLPYGVKCEVTNDFEKCRTIAAIHPSREFGVFVENNYGNLSNPIDVKFEDIKPYLFPLSSMTTEQRIELSEVSNAIYIYSSDAEIVVDRGRENLLQFAPVFDWLNAHHIDYRGLIEKGLAIDATGLNIY